MYNSIGGGRKLVAFYFWEKPACRGLFFLPFSLFSKAPRHEIHTFQSALHREAGILTLIQRDEPEKLSTDPTLLSNKSTNLKKQRARETFLSRLDLGLHTWFPDTEEAQQHQTEV